MRKRYPWRDGNSLVLLVDGEAFFPAMLDAIRAARHSLLLEFYLFSSGRVANKFMTELIAASKRGVMVKIILDGFGGLRFKESDRAQLEHAGVDIVVYNPLHLNKLTRNFARDHRKLLLVDQSVAFIGGTGISDVYWLSESRGCPWHEVMVRVEGPVLADLVETYNDLWDRCTANRLPPAGGHAVVGDASVRVTTVQGMYQQELKVSFIRRVNDAHSRIWLMTAYFMPSFSVRAALRRAAQRGMDVRLIIAGPYTDQPWVFHASKRYYRRLLRAGVRIYEYQPRFLHAKMAVVDDWVSVGSCNLDHWNLRWNLEANIEVERAAFVAQASRMLQEDMQHCVEVTYDNWQKRPWHRKLREVLWSWISQLVLKIR